MSIPAVAQTPAMPINPSQVTTHSGNIADWAFLVPTIGALALGAIFVPYVPMGIAVGVGRTAISLLILNTFFRIDSRAHEHPLLTALAGPILEEGIFRGILQPLTTRVILLLVPAAAAAFAGTALSIAAAVSIAATAAIFGLGHLCNSHNSAYFQAVNATFGGIVYGVLAAQFGLPAAIAAHIVNNTTAVSLRTLRTLRTMARQN